MGNTNVPDKDMNKLEDHPHIHGEHDDYDGRTDSEKGSPPHTWGTR